MHSLNYASTSNIQELVKFYNLGDKGFETDSEFTQDLSSKKLRHFTWRDKIRGFLRQSHVLYVKTLHFLALWQIVLLLANTFTAEGLHGFLLRQSFTFVVFILSNEDTNK